MKFKFPLSSSTWEKEEYTMMQKVIRSGKFTMGKYTKLFEKKFSKFIGNKYCVMVNSGSSANLLMIASLFYSNNPKIKIKRGDEVIVPAISWSTTYYPLYQYGLKIKFVDIDLNTLNYDLKKLKDAVTKNTRIILAVNLLGNPNNFEIIKKIIFKKKIILLEDNCESLGARFKNKFTGTFGLMGSFSFFYSHHISTMEGGLITTKDRELYHILLSLRAHGWTRDLPKKNCVTGIKSDKKFNELFNFVLPGYNVRPLELSAAIGLIQLKRLPKLIFERRKNAQYFKKTLNQKSNIFIQKEISKSSWFGFSLIIKPKSKINRDYLIKYLSAKGFECRPIVTGNFTKNKVIKFFNYEICGDLKNSEYVDNNGLFIGNHHYPLREAIKLLSNI